MELLPLVKIKVNQNLPNLVVKYIIMKFYQKMKNHMLKHHYHHF